METYIYIHLSIEFISDDQLVSHLDPERLHGVILAIMEGADIS